LPWYLRLRIIAEVTTALVFLHSSKPAPYVHRDLKPANILLDQNFSAKLGDVGLARLAPSIASYSVTVYKEDTNPVGTFAYIDPEYQRTGVFTPRSDVYALGLIMLQLLTGKGPIGLTTIVDVALREKKFEEVLDPMAGSWPISEAMEMATMAIHCSELKRKNRPCLEDDILPKLLKLRSFADDHVAQMAWSSMQTVSEPSRAVPSFFICPISKVSMHG
jgi:serine/threonine protein kinase